MATITRGETPTIKYTFRTVDVRNIEVAYVTFVQDGIVKLEKDISSATIGPDYILWTLTQEESLSLDLDSCCFMGNWRTIDGTRGVTRKRSFDVDYNFKEEVI